MVSLNLVSLKEAQFILGRPEEEINRAIDRDGIEKLTEEVVEPAEPTKSKRRRARSMPGPRRRQAQQTHGYRSQRTVTRKIRKIGTPELLFLMIEKELHADLTPAGRRKLYEAIKTAPAASGKIAIGAFEVQLKAASQTIRQRYRALKLVRSGVVEPAGKDPVIKGSEMSVYVLAALARGQSHQEILDDYPGLTSEQLQRAIAYDAAYPKKGRPYPTRSFKRVLGDLADAGVFDDGPADEVVAADPR